MKLSFSMRLKDGIIIGLILVVLVQSYFSPKLTESRFNDTLDEMRVLILENQRRELQINLIQLQDEKDSDYDYISNAPNDSIPFIYSDIIERLLRRDSTIRAKATISGI